MTSSRIESEKPRFLLANYERRLRVLCQKMRQMPATRFDHPQSNRVTPYLDGTIPFHAMGNGYRWTNASSRQKRFILVLTDYFTKWVEAEAYASITDKEVHKFVWENIICRHGLPYEIVTNNGSQFISHNFKEFCDMENSTQYVHTEKPIEQRSSRVHKQNNHRRT